MTKETASLVQAGVFDRIHIAAMWQEGLAETQELGLARRVVRLKLWSRNWGGALGKACRLLEWSVRVFVMFRRSRIAVINCHALSTLPLGVWFKYATGARLVYDTHELETETHGSRGRRQQLARLVERALIRQVDAVIVVSPSIEAWYRRAYGLEDVFLVRNVPHRPAAGAGPERGVLRRALGLSPEDLVFIYQGIFGSGRGIELMLEAWHQMPASHHLVFMGNGPLEPAIAALARRAANVHLHPAVPLGEILNYTSGADVGVSLFEHTCLNYYYALPNKLFEYLFAGVPVIVSDFPDMAQVVDEFGCGWKTPVEPAAFVRLVQSIDRAQIAARREGAGRCRAASGWHLEEINLLRAYAKIAPGPGRPPD
jgi:glycosyltransferase involved in cell wall biosynthesis